MKRFRSARLFAVGAACIAGFVLAFCYTRFNHPLFAAYGKGGVAIVRYDCFVVTKEKQNVVLINRAKWIGKNSTESESVVLGDISVIPFEWSMIWDRPTVIRFTAAKIYIYNLRSMTGGYYLRADD